MSRGARHLLLLSRSGPQGDDALTLLEELKTKGVDAVSPPCDISDESALKDVLARYGKILPPIKGCIQGSMVLKVRRLSSTPNYVQTNKTIGWAV